MLSRTQLSQDLETNRDIAIFNPVVASPRCYGITIFTLRFADVREFYVDLLNAHVVHEKTGKTCQMDLAGLPVCLRQAEHGEAVSYFHLNLALTRQESVLSELRRRGIIVTTVGPFTNFRDPEGRVIKLSEEAISTT